MLFSSLYSRFLLFTGGQDPIFDEQLMVSEDLALVSVQNV